MLAYRRGDFEALARHRAVRRWADDGLLAKEAASALLARFPQPFYSPNVFTRIGLFAFGLVCAAAGIGLAFLGAIGQAHETGMGILLLVYGAICIGVREALARRAYKPFFRAGVEEAVAYFGLGCIIAGSLLLVRYSGDPHAGLALYLAALFALGAARYADSLLAIGSLGALVFALLDAGRTLGSAGIYLLPPAVIGSSSALAYACGRASRSPSLMPWSHLWKTVRFLSLLLAYAGGNYFVVRELGGALLGGGAGPGSGRAADIPFAWLFYIHTFVTPIAFLYRGLRAKDRGFLDAGLIAIAAGVLTYKYYHDVMSLETGLVLAGLALLAAGWAALKAFRPPRFGIGAAADARVRDGLLDAESLAAWNLMGHAAPGKAPDGFQGGGGAFGGGGAQGGF